MNEYKYEVQYIDDLGEPVGYESTADLRMAIIRATSTLTQFLQPYELRYAKILDIETGESISAYRTAPEGIIRQINVNELPK